MSVLRGVGPPPAFPRGSKGLRVPDQDESHLEYLETSKPQTIKRAEKRDVIAFGDGYTVIGNPKLGDFKAQYKVQLIDGKWDCACYHTQHGDARSRQTCTHVIGVWLHRRADGNAPREVVEESAGLVDDPMMLPLEEEESPLVAEEVTRDPGKKPKKGKKKKGGTPPRTKLTKKQKKKRKRERKKLPEIAEEKIILLPSSPSLIPNGWQAVPEWLEEYRPHQWDAAMEVEEAIRGGARVIYLDAPTGSGKTGIADLISRFEHRRLLYLCSSKQLQDQVLGDFPYARVLKGRANYPTVNYPRSFPEITGDDCNGEFSSNNCNYCPQMSGCPYRVAKQRALRSQLSVLNTAYWIREANHVGGFARPAAPESPDPVKQLGGLFVVDECDTLEDALLGFVDFRLTRAMMRRLSLTSEPPKKGSHRTTIAEWMIETLLPVIAAEMKAQPGDIEGERARRRLATFLDETANIAGEYAEDEEERWIRDNDEAPLSLKPVMVARYGRERVWPHIGTAILMSATIISGEELTESLGVDRETYTVEVPMTFPVANMPINVAPVASMKGGIKKATENGEAKKLADAVVRVCELHPGERVLVHCVSYALMNYLIMHTRQHIHRPWFSYSAAAERDQALASYRATEGAVLFAPSFDRGVDLKGDDCRVIIVAKVPKPYIGDARVGARLRMPDGDQWYAVQTIRTLVQMTGRGMRDATDHCTTYILDADFIGIQNQYRSLLPKWWREALNNRFKTRLLTD